MKKTIRQRRAASALTLLLALCLGLGAPMSLSGCAVTVRAEELSAGYVRTATEEGEVTEAFTAAMADFSMTLFASVTEEERALGKANHLVSPLSAMICLSMMANGAEGETLAQMEAALGMPVAELNKALYAYTEGLYLGEDCKVTLADSIWYREGAGFTVREEFLQTCADWYHAQQYAAPFDEGTRKDVNAWVKKYTDGMIDSILEEPIDPLVMMYVINTLVFDAKWQEEYEKSDIKDDEFTTLSGGTVAVEMLCSEEHTYLSLPGGQGFARPYKGWGYSFVGILPDEGADVYDFAAALTGEAWRDAWASRATSQVFVRIPEFSYESSMDLTPVLKAMGMTDLFDSGLADLSGMGEFAGGNLYCSGVYQKTYVEVDRHGTKAAAVTWGTMCGEAAAPAEPKYVYLDRPFVWAIVDNATGLPLFVGVVTGL